MLPLRRSGQAPGHLRPIILTPTGTSGRRRAFAALGPAILALALAACARGQGEAPKASIPEPGPGFPVPARGQLSLYLDDDGSFSPLTDDVAPHRAPRPFPMAVTAASIQPLDRGAVLAINRKGLRRVRAARQAAADGSAATEIRLVIEPLPGAEAEFDGRTVAPSWAHGGEALILLSRHPIFELQAPRSPSSIIVAATRDGARVLEPGVGEDAYAVFPISAESWLAQYRTETIDRVTTSYARVPAAGGQPERLDRAVFERLASPEPMASAPEALRAAADILTGPLLVEARLADGSRRAFVRGDPGEAAPAWASVAAGTEYAAAACIATDDWRVAIATRSVSGYTASLLSPRSPVPGARIRDAALVDGLVVALWEEDLFPDTGASGIVALDPGL